MLISPAFAQSGGFAEGGLGLMPIILVMVIFYFLLIRPQQKRAKQHKACLLYTSPSPRDLSTSRMPSSA